jgi:hypothetical protein
MPTNQALQVFYGTVPLTPSNPETQLRQAERTLLGILRRTLRECGRRGAMVLINRQLRRWLRSEIWAASCCDTPSAWIRTLPCAICGIIPSEAAHTGPHGLGQRSSDYTCIPLCTEHHTMAADALHRLGVREFEQRFNLDLAALVRRLNRIWFQQWKIEGGQFS